MLESKFQAQLIKDIERALPGCVVMKNDANYRQGFPDLLVLHRDRWATLEVKANFNSSVQPNQQYWVDKLDDMSYSAFVHPENRDEILAKLVFHLV